LHACCILSQYTADTRNYVAWGNGIFDMSIVQYMPIQCVGAKTFIITKPMSDLFGMTGNYLTMTITLISNSCE
jgi:hypothetical protein